MKKIRRVLWTLLIVALVGFGAALAWYFTLGPGDLMPWLIELGWVEDPTAPLMVTGLLEALDVTVSAELGGRLAVVYVEEGEAVQAGDLLVALDSTLWEAQLAEAEAGIAVARAALVQAEAGARVERIQEAEAVLAKAVAARDGAYQAWLDTQSIRADPQELDDQIDQARAQFEVADHLVKQAVASKDAVEIVRNNVDWAVSQFNSLLIIDVPLPGGSTYPIRLDSVSGNRLRSSVEHQWWYAWTLVNTAGAGRDGAQGVLNELLRIRQSPHELDAQVAMARSKYESALAMVAAAQANLDALRAGATEQQLEVVRARVEEAEAAKQLVEMQLAKSRIYSPLSGTVVELPLYAGESAQPGTRLAIIANLDTIELTVYVPEDRLGWVSLGQRVAVRVDAFPDRTFEGQVVYIASEAEYTLRAVETKEERVNMVFAVRIDLSNAGQLLKPGMPADVTLPRPVHHGD